MLRELRRGAGLTIEELAERSGVSPRTIGGIERGQIRRPQDGTLDALADALGAGARQRLRGADPAADGLPRRTPCFTGRDDDLAWLIDAARRHRVVEIAGLPGIGKSALVAQAAVHLAEHFPGGVREVTGPAPHGERALLIIDDAGGTAQIARMLRESGPATAIVITSGPPIGPCRRVLGPLSPEESERALRRMIGTDRPAPDLARHGHGLPLALRIIANRVRTRPGWTARPERLLGTLTAGDLSVAAAFRAGCRRLPETARAAVRALGRGVPDDDVLPALAECGWAPDGRIHPILRAFATAR